MKTLVLIILSIFISNAYSNEDFLNRIDQNLSVKMGELTGAGSQYSVKVLAGFVHSKGYIMTEECSNIILRSNQNPKVSDIVKIQVGNEIIQAHELTGFIVKN